MVGGASHAPDRRRTILDYRSVRQHVRRLDPRRTDRAITDSHDRHLRDVACAIDGRIFAGTAAHTVVRRLGDGRPHSQRTRFPNNRAEPGASYHAAQPGRWGVGRFVGGTVLVTVIVVRLLWTLASALWARWRIKRQGASAPGDGPLPSWRTGLIIGWAGTRGLVTVATALALPQNFPERSLLLFIAFTVTLGTLLIQGVTLRSLLISLGVRDDDTIDRELREARAVTAEAALTAVREETGKDAEALRAELEAERRIAESADKGDGLPISPAKVLRAKALAARRDRLVALRSDGVIGDRAFQRLEEELDFSDLAVATRT